MPLATGLDILQAARAGKYGVGAFNTNDLEITQAVLEACEAARSPVLLALSEGALKYGGKPLVDLVLGMGREATVPVAVHLDHGSSFESCVRCIRLGFTSVMIDKSHEDEATNIAETKRVVDAAHAAGVSVEAEIGRLGGVEEHVVVPPRTPSSRSPTRPSASWRPPAPTSWPSRSAPATAPTRARAAPTSTTSASARSRRSCRTRW
jgi:ketose-bisphosphate aldolase